MISRNGDGNEIINTTFSELSVIIIFIILIFIGNDIAKMAELQDENTSIKEILNNDDLRNELISELAPVREIHNKGYTVKEFIEAYEGSNTENEKLISELTTINEKNKSLTSSLNDVREENKKVTKESDFIKRKYKQFAVGSGVGPCWYESKKDNDFLLNVVVYGDGNYLITPIWNATHDEIVIKSSKIYNLKKSCANGCILSRSRFISLGRHIRAFGYKEGNVEPLACLLRVRFFDNSPSKNNSDELELVQRFFSTSTRYKKQNYSSWKEKN
jgi:hypothetical protein